MCQKSLAFVRGAFLCVTGSRAHTALILHVYLLFYSTIIIVSSEASNPIYTYGASILRVPSEKVFNIDSSMVSLSSAMFRTLQTTEGIGLAANQVGVAKQMFVYSLGGQMRALFNPVILESSGEWLYKEGCLSLPGVYADIKRPREILLEAVDIKGNTVNIEATDLLARLFQHEVDHLNGVLLLDMLDQQEKDSLLHEYYARNSKDANKLS